MQRAVFAYRNLADEGVVSVSSNLTSTPPARLTSQYPQIVKKCRNNGETTWAVIVDLLSLQQIDVFALFGLNLTSAGTAQFRASTADSSGQAGDAYDSGPPTAGLVDPMYNALIRRVAETVTARYVRFDVAQPGLPYIEAGRAGVWRGQQVSANFSPGFGRNRVDLTKFSETEDGVEYGDRRAKYRQWDLSFDFLSDDEANGFVEDMSYRNGETDDVLLMLDPESVNLGRDSIYGRITGGQPLIGTSASADVYSRKFTIRERR